MATEDTQPQSPKASSPEVTNSKKRKNSVEEIAVDLSLPEPPSKKAKRLLKKGKVLPAKPASDAGDASDAEGESKDGEKKKSTAKKERSPYGVWIGNLRFTVTKKELREWLIENSGGVITEDLITRVHMPSNKADKKEKKEKRVGGKKDEEEEEDESEKKGFQNKGFAYVDFSTELANMAAIALSETEWHRRKLLIKDAKSFEGRPAKIEPEPVAADAVGKGAAKPEAAAASTATKIFVGNLSFNTNEDELWSHFEKCGAIRWVKVATFEDTGKCKGYGWVNFEMPEAAQWAVKGFVKIKETIETIEDFEDPKDDEDTEPEDAEGKTQLVKREKIRKWWVNQLNGRQLKIQLAEDDQTRYKKRFGKDKPKVPGADRPQRRERQQQNGERGVVDNDKLSGGNRRSWKERRDEDNAADPLPPAKERRGGEENKKDREIAYHDDIQVARLTGAAVKPMGKKVTFD
jgi:RNA recognition motif-containing protein